MIELHYDSDQDFLPWCIENNKDINKVWDDNKWYDLFGVDEDKCCICSIPTLILTYI